MKRRPPTPPRPIAPPPGWTVEQDRREEWLALSEIEGPTRLPAPRHLVLAFMAGLSMAAGYSARLYVDELLTVLATRVRKGDV